MNIKSCASVLLIVTLLTGGTFSSLQELTKANNKFTFQLYQVLRNVYYGNIVVSPISLQVVLAMALQGANDTTADEIGEVLHIGDNQQVLEGYKTFMSGLQSPTLLKIAATMFVEKSFSIAPEFENVVTQYFLTEIQKTNFKEDPYESTNEINHWVENKTDGRIKDLFSDGSVNTDTKLLLASAIHFKAEWKTKFNKKNTKVEPFYIKPNVTVNVKMMSMINHPFRFLWDDKLGAQIVEIPYEENGFKMIIVLPDMLHGLAEVESKLSSLDLTEVLSKLVEDSIDIHIPKFRIKKTLQMTDILSKMGMPTAFNNNADFSRISNESLSITKVVQKAVFIVNEKGSEAAAASGVVINNKSFPPQLRCDHPFFYMILKGDVILFVGRFSKP